jgi:histone deacetylase 1/2
MKSPILTKKRYQVATIFVDHFSRLSYIYLQYSTSGAETVEAKKAFEAFAESHGVLVRHYHADNGRFADNLFRNDCNAKNQTQSYCGVNAHWQNGLAERHIRAHQETARTMLLHAKRRWPAAVETYLWPYAVRMASDILRHTPRFDGKIPMALFSNANVAPPKRHFHPFACPVYVLDGEMQQGKGYSKRKWTERARVGLYLGPSPQHARSVHLVLNIATGLVSPQFHVSFDDHFETTRQGAADLLPKSQWQVRAHFTDSDDISKSVELKETRETRAPDVSVLPSPSPLSTENRVSRPETVSLPSSVTDQATAPAIAESPTNAANIPTATAPAATPTSSTRSGRIVRPVTRLIEVMDATLTAGDENDFDSNSEHPLLFAFAASADPDTMYLHEAMRQPDRLQFIEAMKKEVEDHTKNKNWRVVRRSSIHGNVPVLPAVWSMKRKRRIATREVYKWKARLTVHGGKQTKGVNYWDTYAPLVQWSTTRLFLTMGVLRGWHCRQLDFVLAYTQADVECEIYMEIPRGFTVDGDPKDYALRLDKNLYGLKQAGRVWNLHLTRRLLELGFSQSNVDPCVFYRGTCVLLIYCDDTLMMSPSKTELDEVFKILDETFDVSDEGDISDYLGIKVTKLPDGRMSFTQPQLIDSIIADCGLEKPNAKPRETPALSTRIVRRDEDGESWPDEKWKYRSLIGKLNFLEKSTRPDIAYSVHQCARFTANPKLSHAEAVKNIVRYLKGTRELGIILDPKEQALECYADASFGGDWNRATAAHDASTAKSRTGYLITYCGCPIIWASKLQTEIALSTTEAEYIALSQALREVIPLMEQIREARTFGFDFPYAPARVHCKAFEDNSGALEMAVTPKIRPRTKYINCKYHHFRSHVGKTITIHKIDTKDQIADGLTKPLEAVSFFKFRSAVMGHTTMGPAASAERESERILASHGKTNRSPGPSLQRTAPNRGTTTEPGESSTEPLVLSRPTQTGQ